VAAELRYGSAKKGSPQLRRKVKEFLTEVPVLAFDVPADEAYGNLRAELEAAGRPIGSNNLLIAAHALTLGATVVTANVGEFGRIRGLNVENWVK
jgi:tRNA(fMet)-specific endonuclease VapC